MIRILSIYVLCEIIASAAVKILIGAGEYHKAILLSLVRNSIRITTSILLIILGLGVYGSIWGFSVRAVKSLYSSRHAIYLEKLGSTLLRYTYRLAWRVL
jgi:hypothetical protein